MSYSPSRRKAAAFIAAIVSILIFLHVAIAVLVILIRRIHRQRTQDRAHDRAHDRFIPMSRIKTKTQPVPLSMDFEIQLGRHVAAKAPLPRSTSHHPKSPHRPSSIYSMSRSPVQRPPPAHRTYKPPPAIRISPPDKIQRINPPAPPLRISPPDRARITTPLPPEYASRNPPWPDSITRSSYLAAIPIISDTTEISNDDLDTLGERGVVNKSFAEMLALRQSRDKGLAVLIGSEGSSTVASRGDLSEVAMLGTPHAEGPSKARAAHRERFTLRLGGQPGLVSNRLATYHRLHGKTEESHTPSETDLELRPVKKSHTHAGNSTKTAAKLRKAPGIKKREESCGYVSDQVATFHTQAKAIQSQGRERERAWKHPDSGQHDDPFVDEPSDSDGDDTDGDKVGTLRGIKPPAPLVVRKVAPY